MELGYVPNAELTSIALVRDEVIIQHNYIYSGTCIYQDTIEGREVHFSDLLKLWVLKNHPV